MQTGIHLSRDLQLWMMLVGMMITTKRKCVNDIFFYLFLFLLNGF